MTEGDQRHLYKNHTQENPLSDLKLFGCILLDRVLA